MHTRTRIRQGRAGFIISSACRSPPVYSSQRSSIPGPAQTGAGPGAPSDHGAC